MDAEEIGVVVILFDDVAPDIIFLIPLEKNSATSFMGKFSSTLPTLLKFLSIEELQVSLSGVEASLGSRVCVEGSEFILGVPLGVK